MTEIDINKLQYYKWQIFYRMFFLPAYNAIKEEIKKGRKSKLPYLYVDLYNTSLEVLRVYLANHGIFRTSNFEIIKESYYVGLIDYGRIWMENMRMIDDSGLDIIKKQLPKYTDKEHFKIFENFKTKFEEYMLNE